MTLDSYTNDFLKPKNYSKKFVVEISRVSLVCIKKCIICERKWNMTIT